MLRTGFVRQQVVRVPVFAGIGGVAVPGAGLARGWCRQEIEMVLMALLFSSGQLVLVCCA